jgi:hypothetical protein
MEKSILVTETMVKNLDTITKNQNVMSIPVELCMRTRIRDLYFIVFIQK